MIEWYVIRGTMVGQSEIRIRATSLHNAAESFARTVGLIVADIVQKHDQSLVPYVEFRLGTGMGFIAFRALDQ